MSQSSLAFLALITCAFEAWVKAVGALLACGLDSSGLVCRNFGERAPAMLEDYKVPEIFLDDLHACLGG